MGGNGSITLLINLLMVRLFVEQPRSSKKKTVEKVEGFSEIIFTMLYMNHEQNVMGFDAQWKILD